MDKRYAAIPILFALIFFLCAGTVNGAAHRPDIISHDAALLQNAIEVNVKWQSEYPVIRAQVMAGNKSREIELDPYDDNIKDVHGYHGEASLMVPVDSSGFYENHISYVIQLEDDVGHMSSRVSGRLRISSANITDEEADREDELTREFIDRRDKEKKEGVIEKVLKVIERHDTPPVILGITVNRPGKMKVNFATQGIDDKGLKAITFRIYDAEGNIVQEETLSNLGKIWKGTTQTFSLPYGTYKVIAQATDTEGNTSPEKSRDFDMSVESGTLMVSIEPQTVIAAGGQWRVDNGPWQQSGTTLSGLIAGPHTVEFKSVQGWTEPENRDVVMGIEKLTRMTGTYGLGKSAVTVVQE